MGSRVGRDKLSGTSIGMPGMAEREILKMVPLTYPASTSRLGNALQDKSDRVIGCFGEKQ